MRYDEIRPGDVIIHEGGTEALTVMVAAVLPHRDVGFVDIIGIFVRTSNTWRTVRTQVHPFNWTKRKHDDVYEPGSNGGWRETTIVRPGRTA